MITLFGFAGPGLFGLSPPQFFNMDDPASHAVPAASLTAESPDQTPPAPDRQGEIPALPITNAGQTAITAPPSEPQIAARDAMARPNTPKTLKGPNTSHIELESAKMVAALPPILVPREFISHIPESHLALTGTAQKDSFVKMVLPLILASNEEITKRRDAIKRAYENGDRATLEKWATLYKIDVIDQDNAALKALLLRRADTVPVPLALAQAAVESGWGTSRFAVQGNALFGQWAWRDKAGIRPLNPSDDRAVVRSFGTLLGSVRAYMHNLNTHFHYQKFRDARAGLRDRPKAGDSKILVKFLDRYAEIGRVYVTKLQTLIRTNGFGRYARANLT